MSSNTERPGFEERMREDGWSLIRDLFDVPIQWRHKNGTVVEHRPAKENYNLRGQTPVPF